MKITVVGGGNIGTLMAAEMAHKRHEVTMYTSKPEKWNQALTVFDHDGNTLMTGTLTHITSDLEVAVKGAELIWIAVPAELFVQLGEKLHPLVSPGQMVGVVPGCGGAEFAFHGIIEEGCTLFGLQRVHSIARLEEYGKSVYMLGRKRNLDLGSIPAKESIVLSRMVENLFDIPCRALPNYLSVTLTPSNPILHTARLYAMFKDYRPGITYPRNYLFYEEWTQLSSEILIACDGELQKLCKTIPLDLSSVMSLKDYYESDTPEAMTEKISGIKAFQRLASPMVRCKEGWIPDFNSRYFSTDFPYGLKVIKDLAVIFGVKTPYIDMVWSWYSELDTKHAEAAFRTTCEKKDVLQMYC